MGETKAKMKKKLQKLLRTIPFFTDMFNVLDNKILVNIPQYILLKISRFKNNIYWPVHKTSHVFGDITIGINSNVGANKGVYVQGIGKIVIGNYTIMAQNSGIVSANHSLYNYNEHERTKVVIGDYCWIGMNAVILPGVTLGNHTIVGAGAIVTKSFEEGYCVIAGNPAKVIKKLDPNECIDWKDKNEYVGYIPLKKLGKYSKKGIIK